MGWTELGVWLNERENECHTFLFDVLPLPRLCSLCNSLAEERHELSITKVEDSVQYDMGRSQGRSAHLSLVNLE